MPESPTPPPLVPPLNWLALAAVAGLVTLAGIWAFTGTIVRMVDGPGIVMRDSEFGIYEVTGEIHGTLTKVFVKEGDAVAAGQPVAEISGQFIRAARAGRVIEVDLAPGDTIHPGKTLMRLESLEGELEALVYVSAVEGKRVRKGMEARFVPASGKSVNSGFLRARVRYVSPHPVTRNYLTRELGGNERLADWLLEQDNRTEVALELLRDPGQPDGYAWSTGKAISPVESGLLINGYVIFDRVRPIDWLTSLKRE